MVNTPKQKFESAIQERVVKPTQIKDRAPGFGMVLAYDKESNTAMVQMTRPGSDQLGEVYKGVICPLQLGVQGVAPEPGRICYVVFEGGTQSRPVIVAFYSPDHFEVDFNKQNKISDEIPHYLKNMG